MGLSVAAIVALTMSNVVDAGVTIVAVAGVLVGYAHMMSCNQTNDVMRCDAM